MSTVNDRLRPMRSASAIVSPRRASVPTRVAFATSFAPAPEPRGPATRTDPRWASSEDPSFDEAVRAAGEDQERSRLRLRQAPQNRGIEQAGARWQRRREPSDREGAHRRHLDHGGRAVGARGDPVGTLGHGAERRGVGNDRDDHLCPADGLGRALRPHCPELHELIGLLGGAVPHDQLVPGVEEPAREPPAHRPQPDHRHLGHADHDGPRRDVRHPGAVPKVTRRSCPPSTARGGACAYRGTRYRRRGRKMITGDMAREQIPRIDVREADAFRRSRATRTAQRHDRRAVARKAYSGFVAILATPFRH